MLCAVAVNAYGRRYGGGGGGYGGGGGGYGGGGGMGGGGNGATSVSAAVISNQRTSYYDVPSRTYAYPTNVYVDSQSSPVNLVFRSSSSPVNVQQ